MSSASETDAAGDDLGSAITDGAGPNSAGPDKRLPPVEAPTATFVLQLFFIPLVIVTIIVLVWMMFSWLAFKGSDPKELVAEIRRGHAGGWQSAGTLADMLRERGRGLHNDRELARELADLLQDETKAASTDANRVNLRIFLCRALGEFSVDDALPALLGAAATARSEEEVGVQRAALEALAVLINNIDEKSSRQGNVASKKMRDNTELTSVLIAASRASNAETPAGNGARQVRAAAGFALGVLGGPAAIERLAEMREDGSANARYNAAAGLARHGDVRAIDVLAEMLDPDNPFSIEEEPNESSQSFKRESVLLIGLQATQRLIDTNRADDLSTLHQPLTRLTEADIPRGLRIEANEALRELAKR